VRSTSYLFPGTSVSNAQAAAFQTQGFEIALHLWVSATRRQASGDGNCHNFPSTGVRRQRPRSASWQLFRTTYPSIVAPATNRNHCIIYSDWSSVPRVELANGIRLDTNYYYWPASWVQDRPGFFTGSGFPMRFAETDGSLIDVYQATTQLTDESGQDVAGRDKGPARQRHRGRRLLRRLHGQHAHRRARQPGRRCDHRRGTGPRGARRLGAPDAHVARRPQHVVLPGALLQRRAPELQRGPGRRRDRAAGMLPASGPTGPLQGIARNGQPVAYATQTIKGITYATFPADAGSYVATYPAPAAVPAPVTGASTKAPARIRTVEVLSRRTAAPTFPRLKLSTHKLRPGGGRSLAITFRLKHTSRVVLTFRTSKGKIVRRIRTPRRYKAGTVLRLRWDGRDSKGRYVKPGRYTFTLTATGSHYQKTARGSVRVLAATT
jgi:hypothetical protein